MIKVEALKNKITNALFFITNFNNKMQNLNMHIHRWKKRKFVVNGIILPPVYDFALSKHFTCNIERKTDQELFEELCEIHPKKTIHWLEHRNIKVENSGNEEICFFWHGFIGKNIFDEESSSKQINFISDTLRKKYDQKHLPESKIREFTQKNVIIANDSGFGKSIFLTKLANELRDYEKINPTWIVRVDLTNYVYEDREHCLGKLFPNIENNLNDVKEQAKNFMLPMAARKKKVFERKLFEIGIIHYDDLEDALYPRIVILLDGFDEIVPAYRDKTIQLIKVLNQTDIAQVWITTRVSEKNYLENELKTPTLFLTNLTDSESEDYLVRFWKFNCKSKKIKKTMYFNEKARELLNFVKKSSSTKYYSLTEIPLTLFLLAEHVQDMNFPTLSMNMLNDLYANVINRKLEIFIKWKGNMRKGKQAADPGNDSYLVSMRKVHQELAFEHIFFNNILKEYSNELNEWYDKKGESFDKTLSLAGLIKNKEHDFIHRAFAEYFICEYWINNFGRQSEQNKFIEVVLERDSKNKPSTLYEDIRLLLQTQLDKHDKYAEFQQVLENIIEKNMEKTNCERYKNMNVSAYAEKIISKFKVNPKKFGLAPCMNPDSNLRCRH